jgi:hypothetical protein
MKRKNKNGKAVDLSSIPDGFVSGRLASEIAELFRDAANHRRLLLAISSLKQLAQYEKLEDDLIAEMRGQSDPVVANGPGSSGLSRRWVRCHHKDGQKGRHCVLASEHEGPCDFSAEQEPDKAV